MCDACTHTLDSDTKFCASSVILLYTGVCAPAPPWRAPPAAAARPACSPRVVCACCDATGGGVKAGASFTHKDVMLDTPGRTHPLCGGGMRGWVRECVSTYYMCLYI